MYTLLEYGTIPDIKFKVASEDAEVDPNQILSSQRYVYLTKVRWYIEHPEQIELPQLRNGRWWWLASVFKHGDQYFAGNGNHRIAAAVLLGWSELRVRLLEVPWRTTESAAKWCRNAPWSMQTTFSRPRAQRGAS